MKVTLLNEPIKGYSATAQVLYNRGIKDIEHYLNTTDADINDAEALGEESLKRGAKMLVSHLSANNEILVVVDSDNDGFTSSAILINYLHEVCPAFVENKLKYFLHSGKQHGLSDCVDIAMKYKLVVLPDSSSNDYAYHEQLAAAGVDVLVLDHHEADSISKHACIINNQLSDYPNKEFSGAGVVYQFCRYLDKLLNKSYADYFLDLVASGLVGDMMSLKSVETKHLIFKGFQEKNILNPFIYEMSQKNSFSLNKSDYKPSRENGLYISPMGAAFFIVPFVNAIVRSGTQEEKDLIFRSMLKHKAFEIVPSTKRGHKPGDTERVVDQAMRTCTNVKNRQTRVIDSSMEMFEEMIAGGDIMQHKVLLFLLEPGQVDRNVAG